MDEFQKVFQENGFAVIKDVFTKKENENFRNISDEYFANYPSLNFSGGRCLCGYSDITPELKELNTLHKSEKILNVVEAALGGDFIFAHHSDLHQNKITPWHRDLLMGPYSSYQRCDPWNSDNYNIIKVALLLQDHSDNDYGLWVVPTSHAERDDVMRESHCIHSGIGDLVIFDQRILHRGQASQYSDKYMQPRYLITFGYGLDNVHTADHVEGTIARQETQRQGFTF